MNILTISGSNRTGSYNTALIRALPALAPDHSFTELEYAALPLFSQDLENPFPELVEQLKAQIRAADAIIIATPEYNRTMPAALVNLLDWSSRPYGQNAWMGKVVYVMGATGGHIGTALVQTDLRKTLLYLAARVMGQPESYIGTVHEKISAEGVLTDEALQNHLKEVIAAIVAFSKA